LSAAAGTVMNRYREITTINDHSAYWNVSDMTKFLMTLCFGAFVQHVKVRHDTAGMAIFKRHQQVSNTGVATTPLPNGITPAVFRPAVTLSLAPKPDRS